MARSAVLTYLAILGVFHERIEKLMNSRLYSLLQKHKDSL